MFVLLCCLSDTPDDIGGGAAAFLFGLGDGVPGKHQPPVEAPDLRFARVPQILKSVPVDHIDDGAHHGRGLLFDSGGKRSEEKGFESKK